MTLERPLRIGSYRVLRRLGRGGMGVVYEAMHEESACRVALKIVPLPDAGMVQSMRREMAILRRLRHPGIVRLVEDGSFAGAPAPRPYVYRTPLFGRTREVSRLHEMLEKLRSGEGGSLVLTGTSGLGKTRLALDIAAKASGMGIAVIASSCDATRADPLHGLCGLLELVADRCREKGKAEMDRLVGGRARLLARYEPAFLDLPGVGSMPEGAEPEGPAARQRVFLAVHYLLARLSEESPLLLLVEDVHAADDLTLDCLADIYRVQRLERRRLCLVATCGETDDRSAIDALGAELPLSSLGEAEVGEIVGAMLAIPDAPTVFARFLHGRTGGNPLRVAEHVRAAIESGLLYRGESGQWQIGKPGERGATMEDYESLPVPRSAVELCDVRLRALSEEARRLAAAIALGEREPRVDLCLRASALDPEVALAAWGELIAHEIVEERGGDRCRFLEGPMREAAHALATPDERREGHRRLAELHEAALRAGKAPSPLVLAGHWEGAGERERAREHYLEASRRAVRGDARRHAERHYRAALATFSARTREEIEIRIELVNKVLRPRGLSREAEGEARRSLADAQALRQRDLEADALLSLGMVQKETGRAAEGRSFIEAGLRLARDLGQRSLEASALNDLATVCLDTGELDRARQLHIEAVAIFREQGRDQDAGNALGNLANIEASQGRFSEARRLYKEAIKADLRAGNRRLMGYRLANLANIHERQGRPQSARALMKRALAIFREVEDLRVEGYVLQNLARLDQDKGRSADAGEEFARALEIARFIGDRRLEGVVLGNMSILHEEQGRLDEAAQGYARALEIARETGDRRFEGIWLCDLALSYLYHGRAEEAAAMAAEAALLFAEMKERLDLGLTRALEGHIALSIQRSAAAHLREAAAIAAEMSMGVDSTLAKSVAVLERAQRAHEAGQPLVCGQLVTDLSPGILTWLRAHRPEALGAGS